jgi:alanine dehydrogenase
MSLNNKKKIIIPTESYPGEKRVLVLPPSVKVLVDEGNEVFVQSNAGKGIEITDGEYEKAGAKIIHETIDLYANAEDGLIVKLKAPSPEEFSFMNNSLLFCMLHIDQNKERIYYLGKNNLIGLAMEEIRDLRGKRLVDQTHITGEIGVYYAMRHFKKMPEDMKAVILGYGNVGTGAITACSKLGINYKIMRREELSRLNMWLKDADLLINAICWPEEQRINQEYLVTREDIVNSKSNLIILDLSVDFPNPIETIKPTDYVNTFYIEEDRVHISIYGYPGLVPITSSKLYDFQILPIIKKITSNFKQNDELEKAIEKAVINPSNYEWDKFKPESTEVSKLE